MITNASWLVAASAAVVYGDLALAQSELLFHAGFLLAPGLFVPSDYLALARDFHSVPLCGVCRVTGLHAPGFVASRV